MALTGWSAENYLQALTAVWPGQLPFIYSIWCWLPAGVVNGFACNLGQSGQNDHRRGLVVFADGAALRAQARDTVNGTAEATAAPPRGVWYHGAAAFISSNLREVWLNGADKGTDIANISVATPNATYIGVRPDTVFPWMTDGALAGFSAWDAAGMTEQERDDLVAALAAGSNPLTLNQDNGALVDHAGLEDTNDLGPFSMQGSLSVFGSHPPVSAPTKASTGFRRRGVRVITGADPQFPLPVRKHRQIVADPKYRRHILYQDPDAPIRRWVQVVPGPLPARKHVSIEGL